MVVRLVGNDYQFFVLQKLFNTYTITVFVFPYCVFPRFFCIGSICTKLADIEYENIGVLRIIKKEILRIVISRNYVEIERCIICPYTFEIADLEIANCFCINVCTSRGDD